LEVLNFEQLKIGTSLVQLHVVLAGWSPVLFLPETLHGLATLQFAFVVLHAHLLELPGEQHLFVPFSEAGLGDSDVDLVILAE
jgi:hypothetical protein